MSETEIDLAWMLEHDVIASPVRIGRSWLAKLRISGSGVAFRPNVGDAGEYGFRDPKIWCTGRMCRRWLGAPIVVGHPKEGELAEHSYWSTAIGAVIHTWINDEQTELWCVARLFSDELAAELMDGDSLLQLDTSPAVLFDPGELHTITLSDGAVLTVEPEPMLIDHLAVIATKVGEPPPGVWSKEDAGNPGIVKELEDA
jgi:hypothetical protein